MSKDNGLHPLNPRYPRECRYPERTDGSCRWCEYSCDPCLYDGGCILGSDPSPAGIQRNRERYLADLAERFKLEKNHAIPDYRAKRKKVMQFLERVGAFEVLWLWSEFNRDHPEDNRSRCHRKRWH